MKKLTFLFFFGFCVLFSFSQKADTIQFINGEQLITSKYSVNVEEGILTYLNKRNKPKMVGLEFVFSIIDTNNKEKVYFEPTTIDNRFYSVEDMRSFVKGERTALEKYHSPFPLMSGVVTGAGAVYTVPSLLGLNVFFSPLVPAANSAIVGTFNYKEDKIKKKFPEQANDPYFVAGYREVVVQKRITNSIKGGLIGLGLGIASTVIIHSLK